jgi:hypothetical protein
MKTALITINTTSQRLPRSRSPINILNRQAKPPITSSPVTYFHPRIGPTHKVGQGRVHQTAPAPLRSLAQSGRPMSVASVPRRQHSESLLPRLVLSGCCLNRLVPFLVCLSERKKRGIGRSFSISETVVRCVSFSESLGLTFPLERLIVTTYHYYYCDCVTTPRARSLQLITRTRDFEILLDSLVRQAGGACFRLAIF